MSSKTKFLDFFSPAACFWSKQIRAFKGFFLMNDKPELWIKINLSFLQESVLFLLWAIQADKRSIH